MSDPPLDLDLPPPVRSALRWLHEQGYTPYLVGGATRDLLLGRENTDFDFVLAGDGFILSRRLANQLGGAWVPLDADRGVGRIVLHRHDPAIWIDLARFRDAGFSSAEETLRADLELRDFTLNAIALDPLTARVIDPTGGVADLEARRLRPTNPQVFVTDPLRILRAVRFQATHRLTLAAESVPLIRASVAALGTVAGERVREEWLKLLAHPGASERIRELQTLGVLRVLLPELAATVGVTQSAPHSHDAFEHSLLALTALEQLWPWEDDPLWEGPLAPWRDRMVSHLQAPIAHEVARWELLKHVVLLHDIGKPVTRTVGEDGRIHFYGHEGAGAGLMDEVSSRFKLSGAAHRYGREIIAAHLRPLHLAQRLPPRPKALYHLFRDMGALAPDVVLHSLADQRGKTFRTDRREVVEVSPAILSAFFDEPNRYVNISPLLNGHEIIQQFGWSGPKVGQALEFLREQQAMGRIATPEEATRALRGWVPPTRR